VTRSTIRNVGTAHLRGDVSQEYVFETVASIGETQFQKSQLKSWMEPVEAPLPKFLAQTGYKGTVYREPYGVTLIIGPFNGPLLLLIRPAISALAAGNTCVLKLSEQLDATSALLMELVPRYFDPRAVTATKGGREEVTQLLKLPFDFIFFTGSTKVGKIVMKAAAENITPVLLELGGQNPALVDATANIPDAAKKIVWGAMAWGGQWCTSPGYAFHGWRGLSIQLRSFQAGSPMPRHATSIQPSSIRLHGTIQ
jgi:acyl-CoA reductase-like NAD-dependent aldehyde dehydrogenase